MPELAVGELVDAAVGPDGEVTPHAGRRLELDSLDRARGGLEALLSRARDGAAQNKKMGKHNETNNRHEQNTNILKNM